MMDRERIEGGEKSICLELLDNYLGLEKKFQNPPGVRLRLISSSPTGEIIEAESVASSTAIQCYSPGTARMINRRDRKSKAIAESTLNAGHLTTRMHTHYTFQITGITRSVTHDVFHATPFYNSEQQSQRYVLAKEGSFLIPQELSGEQIAFYKKAADFMINTTKLSIDKIAEKIERIWKEKS